jgi:hypothetical protein
MKLAILIACMRFLIVAIAVYGYYRPTVEVTWFSRTFTLF